MWVWYERCLTLVVTRDPIPRWVLFLLCLGAAAMLIPFAPWVVLAVWLGIYAQQIHVPMMRVFGGRRGLSASISVLLLVIFVLPLAAMTASLVIDAIALVRQLLETKEGQSILERLAAGEKQSGAQVTEKALSSPAGMTDLVMAQGDRAWAIARQVAGAAIHVVIGLLILVTGMYAILVEGRSWYTWIEQHAPVPASTVKRFADAFVETGRGLAFGIVGAGLIQSVVATAAYVIIGVPSALALGMLTLLFSVIPAIGTALVWVPVSAGLYMTGRPEAAIALFVIGAVVVGTVDNLARPWLTRRGHLQLPTYVVLIAMFGGIELIGAWGLILGPLFCRLAKEAILIRTEAVVPTAPHQPGPAEAVPPPAAEVRDLPPAVIQPER